jgi:hypothetical protein
LHDRLAAAGNATGEAKEKRAEEAAPLKPVFIHGWVYDLESGTVADLNVSTGPEGFGNFIPSETPENETGEENKPEEDGASTSTLPEETASATATEDVAKETPTEVSAEPTIDSGNPPASVVQGPVSATPDAAFNVIGHDVIPAKRSSVLARLRRSLPQERKRFRRQI